MNLNCSKLLLCELEVRKKCVMKKGCKALKIFKKLCLSAV